MTDKIHDLVIIGAGPSALTAAIYTTREDIETLIFEKSSIGGLAAVTDTIENYPGFSEGVKGAVLAEQLQKQAGRFGAQIEFGEVESLELADDIKTLTVDGKKVKARTLLIATGSKYGKINVPGEAECYGRGVHYCATCDGPFYKNKRLAVVGGGNSAVQEALFLTRFAIHIDLLVRSNIKACKELQRKLQTQVDNGKITVHLETTIDGIEALDDRVVYVNVAEKGEPLKIEIDGVFIFAGLKPNTEFLRNTKIELDEIGFIKTDTDLQTNIPGVFASGDVRSGATMQIACAVGEGALAAHSIRKYLQY